MSVTSTGCRLRSIPASLAPKKHGGLRLRSEDANVEHLFDVFTSVDTDSDDVWDACAGVMRHLYRHKRRPVMLVPKIEGLPDVHHSKPEWLFRLSWLFRSVGNYAESKRLLAYILKLWRERGDTAIPVSLFLSFPLTRTSSPAPVDPIYLLNVPRLFCYGSSIGLSPRCLDLSIPYYTCFTLIYLPGVFCFQSFGCNCH